MSTAKQHAEWLSLMEISGPFLSMPVLLTAFPQGVDAHDPDHAQQLKAAYEEWSDNQGGLTPDPAIHHAWLRFVLSQTLGFPDEVMAERQAIPEMMKATLAELGETIRPDMMVVDPDSHAPQLLIHTYPVSQNLNKIVAGRNWKVAPATRMMELLQATEVRLGLVTNGEHWLLVQAKRGETTGYIGWYAGLWQEERLTLRAFRTLLGVGRFFGVPEEQTLPALLDASEKDQHEITDQLGYQVRSAVEILVQAIDRADQDAGRALLVDVAESRLYEAALTVMMRLVFLLTAEERDLLLSGDPIYDQYYAVSTLRAQLRTQADQAGEELLERGLDAWSRLLATFRAVYGGVQHEDLTLPAYGGSLFDPDRFPFLEGRQLNTSWTTVQAAPLPINNRTVLHLLEALQILRVKVPGGGSAEARRMSFRALDIEQIGHVYEGLLDHQAVRATELVAGLAGTKHQEPEIPLSQLEAAQANGQKALLIFLGERTGRSEAALKNSLAAELDGQEKERLRTACGNVEALYQRVLPFAGLVRNDDYGWPVVITSGSVYVTTGTTRRATGTHYTPRSLTEPIVQHTLEPLVYSGPAEGLPREEWRLHPPARLLALKICDMAMGSGAFLVQVCRYLGERLVEAWGEVVSGEFASGEFASGEFASGEFASGTFASGEFASGEFASGAVPAPQSLTTKLQITPEGYPATGDPKETLIPDDDEERLLLAKRLVADRCLYGVDKNHLAVEMAKLSLWLITLDKNRPFTFLDHALKHGDSLIGADDDMFLRWAHGLRDSSMPLFDQEIRGLVETAREKRRALQAFEVRNVRDAEEKARLLAEADTATARIKLGCDLLVGARLLDELSSKEQDALLANGLLDYIAGRAWQDPTATRAVQAARTLTALHWHFEFPEVFAQGGFSGFVGNPPFIGGQRIRAAMGGEYLSYLKTTWNHAKGSADYSAYFFLRAYEQLHSGGALGLIATNTIAQGATLELGLDYLHERGAEVYHANNDYPWPGLAAVVVDVVHVYKGKFAGQKMLDDAPVKNITPQLDDMPFYGKPYTLQANANQSFQGSIILGLGFTMLPEEAAAHIERNPQNKDVLLPYLNGQDLNSSPTQEPSRWVINFFDWPLDRTAEGHWQTADAKQKKAWLQTGRVPADYTDPVAEDYPEMLEIVRREVYPQRMAQRREIRKRYWWRYGETAVSLYETIAPLGRVLVVSQVSKHHGFVFIKTGDVHDQRLVTIASDRNCDFAVVQSTIHNVWFLHQGSSLETRPTYTPSDCFVTFPFPPAENMAPLEAIGAAYHSHRQETMQAHEEGLTQTYNRFHDPSEKSAAIAILRTLHRQLDEAVAAAYGWADLPLGHGFHETAQGTRYTISDTAQRQVLTRLLKLNHKRYAEEVAQGLHDKKNKSTQSRKGAKKKKEAAKKKNDKQLSLL